MRHNHLASILTDADTRLLALAQAVSEGRAPATAMTVAEWERAEVVTDIVCAYSAKGLSR